MSERTRNGKSFAQDATGFVFCLVGGFFAVSIVQFLRGHEPKESVSALTRPVTGLAASVGSTGALVFALGLAALGVVLFLRATTVAPLRPLGALVLAALGTALVCGAFGAGGTLGGWLPGLVGSFAGRAIGVVLGAALAWLGWTLAFEPRVPLESTAEAIQRIGLASRQDAAGVSPAEAALLVPEARPVAKPVATPRREELQRMETPRPRATPDPRPEPAARAVQPPVAFDPSLSLLTPPAPSWEGEERDEEAQESAASSSSAAHTPAPSESEGSDELDEERAAEEDLETLRASRADVFAVREEAEEEVVLEEEAPDEEESFAPPFAEEDELIDARDSLPVPSPVTPSWEQVGLFDELDEAPRPADALTPSFDFEAPASAAPSAPRHPAPGVAKESAPEATVTNFTLTPAAPRPAPAVARDEDQGRWEKLVYEAGCLILEQKRVAVSMLERRFGIDFDQACRVLDELQQAGLIGPYIGGRSRDILLTREEWLPHAPHAS